MIQGAAHSRSHLCPDGIARTEPLVAQREAADDAAEDDGPRDDHRPRAPGGERSEAVKEFRHAGFLSCGAHDEAPSPPTSPENITRTVSSRDPAASRAIRRMALACTGPVRSEAARLAILDAAVSLFAERGYDHLTMKGIARCAGVGK